MNKAACLTRNTIAPTEFHATRKWMQAENPARSGDKQAICWMVMSAQDFYADQYCSPAHQKKIIKLALEENREQLEEESRSPKTSWMKNVRLYLDAETNNTLDTLRVRKGLVQYEAPEQRLPDALNDLDWFEGNAERLAEDVLGPAASAPENEQDEIFSPDKNAAELVPRTMSFFYKSLLKGLRLWQRPPHNHCDRCEEYTTAQTRHKELSEELFSVESHPDHERYQKLIHSAGGFNSAHAEVRHLLLKLPDLKKHVDWFTNTRPYLKKREEEMEDDTVVMELDYGGFTDSAGKKIGVWSATVIGKNRKQEHFDYFFDLAGKVVKGKKKAK
jgi:hypothetical protein